MSRMPGLTLPANLPQVAARYRAHADKLRNQLGTTAELPRWYRISNATADEAEVMLYDEVGGLFGAFADEFIDELKGITAPRMRVRVNSPGGGVFEGVAIANALRAHPAEVTVQIDGLAASIASVIAMAGDRVVIQPQAMVMIHDASGACLGNAADMQEMADLLDKISDNIADAYTQRAGGTRDEWRARMRAESWYTAEEAVAAGLADEVMPAPKKRGAPEPDGDEPEMRKRYDLTAYGYQGPPKREERVSLTFNLGEEFGEQFAALAKEMVRQRGPAAVKNVLRQFDEGDLVRVVGTPHEPGHCEGRVAVVNGNAYGVIFDQPDDDTMPGEPYLWYVDNELEFVAEGPDREGEGYGEEPEEPEPVEEPAEAEEPGEAPEELRPGVSHPMGRPIPTGRTRTVVDAATPVHHTATVDGTWDGSAQEKRLPSPMTVDTAKAMYGWYDPAQAQDGKLPKAACKFPHHDVTADGKPGPANLAGVRNALARLPQADIPADQRAAVERHLRAHLDDAKPGNHTDDWAAITAHLTEPDPWTALTHHLFTTASSSAATNAA